MPCADPRSIRSAWPSGRKHSTACCREMDACSICTSAVANLFEKRQSQPQVLHRHLLSSRNSVRFITRDNQAEAATSVRHPFSLRPLHLPAKESRFVVQRYLRNDIRALQDAQLSTCRWVCRPHRRFETRRAGAIWSRTSSRLPPLCLSRHSCRLQHEQMRQMNMATRTISEYMNIWFGQCKASCKLPVPAAPVLPAHSETA